MGPRTTRNKSGKGMLAQGNEVHYSDKLFREIEKQDNEEADHEGPGDHRTTSKNRQGNAHVETSS